MDIKKVFAYIPTDDFYRLKNRCKKENISIDQCLTKIVKAYGNGANIVHIATPIKNKHAKSTGADYKGIKNEN